MAKILIVDDSESVLVFTKDILEADGHKVFIAKNGLEANKVIFSKEKPDLILLDFIMPMLNGDKVIQAFQQSEISRAIPVVFFSTKNEDDLKALVEKHKNMGYIHKPSGAKELCAAVRRFLNQ